MLAIIAPVPTSSSGSESSLAGPKSSSPSYLSPSKLSSKGSVVSAEVCPSTSTSVPIACRRADSGVLGHSFDPLWCPFCPHAKHASAVGMLCLPGTCCPVGIPWSLVRGTAVVLGVVPKIACHLLALRPVVRVVVATHTVDVPYVRVLHFSNTAVL